MARAVLTRAPEGLIVRRPIHSGSVEQIAQEALAPPLVAALVAMFVAMIFMAAAMLVEHPEASASGRAGSFIADAALYDLVEFAAIEPDAATLRTSVDFNALALAHDEIHPARWA